MGYFSNLDAEPYKYHDHSITPPELQLQWRLDDLRERIDELKNTSGLYGGVCRLHIIGI